MQFETFKSIIPQLEQKPLAGDAAHNEVMNLKVRFNLFKELRHPDKMKASAVLALFYPDQNSETRLLFILRKTYDGHHSGQIAFPGGKQEKTDRNLIETAFRETFEEVNVQPQDIKIIKPLSEVHIPISNYRVQPYLAYAENKPDFVKDELEVEKILEFPLKKILDKNLIQIEKTYFNRKYQLAAFQIDGYVIWGATAMILSEIIQLFD